MKRALVYFGDGKTVNLKADGICFQDGILTVWDGEFVVGVFKMEAVTAAYITEAKG